MKQPLPGTAELADLVRGGDTMWLARAITLVESRKHEHRAQAAELLTALMPDSGGADRIGLTGVPGVGKSTFIDQFGTNLTDAGHRVAVLAVDPSSSRTGGAILGDKTRMERLSADSNAFIRPSPASGSLGGVARATRESILLCEAAGFDVVLVETVGVGQSETTVSEMVDIFVVLMLSGAGDELQGIKKGIMELADALLVNKADGDNKVRANAAKADYNRALHYLAPATEGWRTRAYTCSAIQGDGIDAIWKVIGDFRQQTTARGVFEKRRQRQTLDWVYSMVEEHLRTSFFNHAGVGSIRAAVEHAVIEGHLPPTVAAQQLIYQYENH